MVPVPHLCIIGENNFRLVSTLNHRPISTYQLQLLRLRRRASTRPEYSAISPPLYLSTAMQRLLLGNLRFEDAYLKCSNVFITTNSMTTFTSLASKILPERSSPVVVSENGTHLTGTELQSRLDSIGCKSVFPAPRHPYSSGLEENFVKALKTAISDEAPITAEDLHNFTIITE